MRGHYRWGVRPPAINLSDLDTSMPWWLAEKWDLPFAALIVFGGFSVWMIVVWLLLRAVY